MKLPPFDVPIYYVRQIADAIEAEGKDARRWLKRGSLDFEQLEDLRGTLPFSRFKRMIVDGMEFIQDPALGLYVGARLKLNTHGVLAYAVLNCGTLRQACDMFVRYLPIRTSLVVASTRTTKDEFQVFFEEGYPLAEIMRPVFEAVALTIKNVIDQVSGEEVIKKASFAYPAPAYAARYEPLFRRPVEFARDWTGIALPLDVVDRPLSAVDPGSLRHAVETCELELRHSLLSASWTARVRRLLRSCGKEMPSLPDAAKALRLSSRTLHRRLLSEGASYKGLLDEVRYQKALFELRVKKASIQEIAHDLGYTDVANFRRAFKRWEGTAPSSVRKNT